MRIRTPLDLGLVIRDRRRKLGLSQIELARKVGVGRQWVVAIERGKSRAELGLVLRTFSALGVSIASEADNRPPRSTDDIDAVVSKARSLEAVPD